MSAMIRHALCAMAATAALTAGTATATLLGTAIPASAQQGLFSPAITVNDRVITGYELQQRARMLTLLNAPGNPEQLAREQLIDDRLRMQAAGEMGIEVTEEEIAEGMAEFASRADLSAEQFNQALQQGGVAIETFRDFVRAGIAWRQVVQGRFGGQAQVGEAEIDRALTPQGGSSDVRVLLSELIMPIQQGNADEVRARAQRISQLTSTSEFSSAARQYSATASRDNGGRLPWRNLSELPAQLRPILLGLSPGDVTDPLPLEGAVALFQLRDIEEAGYTPPEITGVEYAAYFMPGGRSPETLARARVLEQRVDRCDDLYGVAKGQPAEVLRRESVPVGDLPTDMAIELSKLDSGEVSTAITRNDGQTLMFLMLCGRSTGAGAGDGEQDRSQVAMSLRNQRLSTLADGYLAQLRSDARIVNQ